MAGEAIRTIKETEKEALAIVNNAMAETKKIVENAGKRNKELIAEKDESLKREGQSIRKRYTDETGKQIEALEAEEVRHIKKVDELCQKTLKKVVSYLSEQIIKE
jgi:vacuolar-type H+-ATPase subunit H